MPVEMNTSLGRIDVSNEVIATIAGGAAVECDGLVGMASGNALKDGFAELLKGDSLSRGVDVRENENGVEIDLNIIVRFGTTISDVARLVQATVKDALEQTLGLQVVAVNIFVQGVRLAENMSSQSK
jgi:uncharacterized alkaline shock family protein YloU